jgi:hypothetical protein
MGQVLVYQCWWRIYREINAFSKFEYHMFYVLYQFMTYLLALPPIFLCKRNTAYAHMEMDNEIYE